MYYDKILIILGIAALLTCGPRQQDQTELTSFAKADRTVYHVCDNCQHDRICIEFHYIYLYVVNYNDASWQKWTGDYHFCQDCIHKEFIRCGYCNALIDRSDYFDYSYLMDGYDGLPCCPSCAIARNELLK